jgi:hypothetical protein
MGKEVPVIMPIWIIAVALIVIAIASSMQCWAEWYIRKEIRRLLLSAPNISASVQNAKPTAVGISVPVGVQTPKGRVIVLSDKREAAFAKKQEEGETD